MVGMTNLRNFLTELGFDNVRSLLQSGNLVFGSRSRFGAELERYLEMEAAKRLALEVDIYARTVEEWKSVVRQNPFRKEAERDPGHLMVLFLKNAPAQKDVALLQSEIKGPEIVKAKGKHAYIFYPDGRTGPLQAHERDDRKANRSRYRTELEHGDEARCDREGRLVEADPSHSAQADLTRR